MWGSDTAFASDGRLTGELHQFNNMVAAIVLQYGKKDGDNRVLRIDQRAVRETMGKKVAVLLDHRHNCTTLEFFDPKLKEENRDITKAMKPVKKKGDKKKKPDIETGFVELFGGRALEL